VAGPRRALCPISEDCWPTEECTHRERGLSPPSAAAVIRPSAPRTGVSAIVRTGVSAIVWSGVSAIVWTGISAVVRTGIVRSGAIVSRRVIIRGICIAGPAIISIIGPHRHYRTPPRRQGQKDNGKRHYGRSHRKIPFCAITRCFVFRN
jgi:hypothetical protein